MEKPLITLAFVGALLASGCAARPVRNAAAGGESVTGSRLPGPADRAGSQYTRTVSPTFVYSHDDVLATGAGDLAGFFRQAGTPYGGRRP
jgi:hypothetical protein